MARVHHRKAAKDYPDHGIAKGEMYYYCKRKTGPYSSQVIRQKNPIRRSQLTSSEYLAGLYDWQDEASGRTDAETCRDAASQIREIGEGCQERFDNMPEGLQQGDSGQMLEERANACEEAANELEEIATEFDELDETTDEYQDQLDDLMSRAQEVDVDV